MKSVFLEKDITKADDENRKKVDKREINKNINISKTTVAFHIRVTRFLFSLFIFNLPGTVRMSIVVRNGSSTLRWKD